MKNSNEKVCKNNGFCDDVMLDEKNVFKLTQYLKSIRVS